MKSMSSFLPALAVSLVVAVSGAASAHDTHDSQDQTFVIHAAEGGMAEVALAQLALSKSSAPAVDSFAHHMLTDHTQANQQLEQIARGQGFALPKSVGPHHQMLIDQLQSETGRGFAEHYLHSQLPAHEQMLTLFRQEATSGENPRLVDFAKQTIPVIEQHIAWDRRDIAELGGSGSMSMRDGH
jgi:putative membrane protein